MRKLLLAVALFGLFCMPLFAQDAPKTEVFGGYQMLHAYDTTVNGFTGAVEGNINQNVGIVGDFGFGRKDGANFYSFLGGPQFSYRAEKFRVFGRALFGGAKTAMVDTETHFALAFGGGVDIAMNEMISFRPAQFDIVKVKYPGVWSEAIVRYCAGVVFKLGSK